MKHLIYLACLASAAPATAQGFDAAQAFGARESVEQASLSPDGTKLAYLAPGKGQGSAVFVVRLDQAKMVPAQIMRASGDPERLGRCRWASNTRLVCTAYAVSKVEGSILATVTRIVSFNDDGSKIAVLQHNRGTGDRLGYALFGGAVIDWNPGNDQVLMIREYVPETSTGTRLAQRMEGIGVDSVDPVTLKTKVVEIAQRNASEYITDGQGMVRIRGISEARDGYTTGTRNYFFRRKGQRDWQALSTVTNDEGFDPSGVDPTLDIAYGLKRHNGRLGAFSVALDGSGTEKLIFAHDDVDVTGFARIGRNGRIIGVRYTTDVSAVHYFDPAVGAMIRMLSRAVPKLPLIRVIDSSEDENRMLVWAGSDTDPGRFFLFDRAKKNLNELMLQRPELENVTLAAVKHITYPAADGTMVPAYLTLPASGATKGLPAIVLPHGGPEARDEWGFDWLSQFYVSQGFAVLQPNFRGSAGYGDARVRKNGFQGWKIGIGGGCDAGRRRVKEGIADPAKLSIVGWSYGGYAALQSAVVNPDLFKRVVAIAPVTDLERLKTDAQYYTSANEVERFVGTGPHIREGSPARHAGSIKAPVLMFHGDMDMNVAIGHSNLMQSRLADAGARSELVTFKGLDHYLEDSSARAQMLTKSVEFLKMP